jgi:acetolactate synthase-1/2/3 large subunit
MPQYVIEKLYEVTGGDAFITSDVGQHQMFAAQYYKFDKPRRWINSGGLGTMGVGLPYGMGVLMANPGAQVPASPAKVRSRCVFRNCRLQAVWLADQDHQPEQRHAGHGPPVAGDVLFQVATRSPTWTSLPDFVKLAEAYGHVGMKIEKPEDVEPALRKAFTEHKDDLVFMDFIIDPKANVFPMVAAGKGLTEMILPKICKRKKQTMRHIISILIENESGALSRVAGLFSARGYNIESLTVAPTEDPSLSRMTIVTRAPTRCSSRSPSSSTS